ncbi:MAG TPA: hypothetical protein VGO57_18280 [Verrucomicrobiae bacterium]|jgi:hypothetical protein
MAWLLIAAHFIALGIGLMTFAWMFYLQRRAQRELLTATSLRKNPSAASAALPRPVCWLAVRSVSPESVKEALGLDRAAPCSWTEGLKGGHEFFISPRVHGWVIITGVALPNPSDDVDATFLFLQALSRKLGHVQFFYAERFSHHHAWARLDDGCVTRAYAWAGETVWSQGIETLPEIECDVKTSGYGEHGLSLRDAESNFDRLPQLAARWSLDPAEVKLNSLRQSIGIAGESAWI